MVEGIHIGTSGWSYKHWKDDFYPKGLKQTEWFSYYTRIFRTTEINTSFYRLPSEEMVKDWMKKAPKDFLFCPKMSRYLTHMKKLNDPEEPLEGFFDIFQPMKKQMGPVLIQLPRMIKFKSERHEYFFHLLASSYRQYEFVLEFRHDSWLTDDALNLLAKYNIGLIISQSGSSFPYSEIVTAKNIYVRFHGPKELYASSYSDQELKSFARKFKKWVKKGRVIWAFFNNDIHGYAPKDAIRLEKFCNQTKTKL